MNYLKSFNLYPTLALALFLSLSACKKDSSSPAKIGTLSFTFQGQNVTLPAVADSSGGMGLNIIGLGKMPNSKDTVTVTLNIYNSTGYWANLPLGKYYDTAVSQNGSINILYQSTGNYFYDTNPSNSAFYINITSSGNGNLSGTFQGMTMLDNGSFNASTDSTMVSNGRFSVKM